MIDPPAAKVCQPPTRAASEHDADWKFAGRPASVLASRTDPFMAGLRILMTRRADGGSVLRCERSDGTVTWQRLDGPQAAFFPMHDLTHFAVETVLGTTEGFFGLVAAGWDIADTTGKGTRGPLPAGAMAIERIVGFLDVERGTGGAWSAEEFNEQMRNATAAADKRDQFRALAEDELSRIRTRRRELFGEWNRLAPDAMIELVFDVPGAAGVFEKRMVKQ